jgi:hypothetical protein
VIGYGSTIVLTNCTISQNNLTSTLQSYGAGLALGTGATVTGRNDILYGNIALSYPDFAGNPDLTYSCSSQPLSGPGNIVANPLFVTGPLGAYYLSQVAAGQSVTSFCVDGGDPDAPMVAGTTRTDDGPDTPPVDMGYHYPVAAVPSGLNVTMTPINPPIVIPANGGQFQFTAGVQRTQAPQTAFYAWARDRYPDGTYTSNLLGPVQINPPVGVTVNRTRTQVVPSSWPPGLHYYIGYAHASVSYPATDADSFAWTKTTAADGGAYVWEASNYGEPFPGEELTAGEFPPASFILHPCNPNPFNPSTVASFELRVASYVSLRVYDTAGRLVATLVDGWREAGEHSVTFDGSGLSAGLYFAHLHAGDFTAVSKLMLIK